jgi:hypothetical protein
MFLRDSPPTNPTLSLNSLRTAGAEGQRNDVYSVTPLYAIQIQYFLPYPQGKQKYKHRAARQKEYLKFTAL